MSDTSQGEKYVADAPPRKVNTRSSAELSEPFDATTALFSYLRARGSAPEDDIIRAVEARAEEHSDDTDAGPVHHLLFDLVQSGRLTWRDAPGGAGDLSVPLIYSLSRREKRALAAARGAR